MDEPACRSCHVILDVGFAFEPFDAIGRHRTSDNGAPIDAARAGARPDLRERPSPSAGRSI